MADIPKGSQEKIGKLQQMEHTIQGLDSTRQQLQAQLFELDSAIAALEKAPSAYKIVGSVMVSADPKTLLKELQEKKEILDVRISSVEKQESKLRDSAKALQEEVMSALKKETP